MNQNCLKLFDCEFNMTLNEKDSTFLVIKEIFSSPIRRIKTIDLNVNIVSDIALYWLSLKQVKLMWTARLCHLYYLCYGCIIFYLDDLEDSFCQNTKKLLIHFKSLINCLINRRENLRILSSNLPYYFLQWTIM